jgi:hypothetical protein
MKESFKLNRDGDKLKKTKAEDARCRLSFTFTKEE